MVHLLTIVLAARCNATWPFAPSPLHTVHDHAQADSTVLQDWDRERGVPAPARKTLSGCLAQLLSVQHAAALYDQKVLRVTLVVRQKSAAWQKINLF